MNGSGTIESLLMGCFVSRVPQSRALSCSHWRLAPETWKRQSLSQPLRLERQPGLR